MWEFICNLEQTTGLIIKLKHTTCPITKVQEEHNLPNHQEAHNLPNTQEAHNLPNPQEAHNLPNHQEAANHKNAPGYQDGLRSTVL